MKPGVYDLVIYCGTTLDAAALSFTYAVGGTPVDLTGYTLRSKGAGPKGTVFEATTENGRVGFTTGIARSIVTGAADADATAVAANAVVGDLFFA